MKNFVELKKEYNEKCQSELSKTGIFYAFSNAQFDEYKTHKNVPDNEYLGIGYGAYIHKSNKQKLDNYFNNIKKQLTKDFISKINIDDLIEYELINHECYYTGDWSEIIPLIESYLDSDISQRNDVVELIENVFKNTYNKNNFD